MNFVRQRYLTPLPTIVRPRTARSPDPVIRTSGDTPQHTRDFELPEEILLSSEVAKASSAPLHHTCDTVVIHSSVRSRSPPVYLHVRVRRAPLQRRWEGAHFLQSTFDTTNLTSESQLIRSRCEVRPLWWRSHTPALQWQGDASRIVPTLTVIAWCMASILYSPSIR